MRKKILLGLFSLFMILAAASLAQATIIVSEPEEIYNLGDILEITVRTSYGEELSGFSRILLVCNGASDDSENGETLMYFSPIKLKANREKSNEIEWPVSKAYGSCHIYASLEDDEGVLEETESSTFELTNRIDIKVDLNKESFDPLDELKLDGEAIKANGQAVEGAVTIVIDGEEYSQSSTSRGSFSFSKQLVADIAPGSHSITIAVEDNYENIGSEEFNFEVTAIPTSLEVETENNSFLPSELIIIEPRLLDQAGGIMVKNVLVKLSMQKDGFFNKEIILLEELVTSGNHTLYRFARNATPGNYLIEAEVLKFRAEKTIEVQVYEKLDFIVENETLYVTNVGNVPFQKPLEIRFKIENQTTIQIIELDLDVDETQAFKLSAPDGDYEIEIVVGEETVNFLDIPLIGGVVTVIELKPKRDNNKWRILAIVIALIIVLALLYFKKQKFGKIKKIHKKNSTGIIEAVPKTDSDVKAIFKKHSKDLAACSLIPSLVYGTKQEVTTAIVRIPDTKSKGLNKEESLKILDNFFSAAAEKIKSKQGVADLHGNSLIIMFNIIKQYRHDVAAVRTAQEIRDICAKLQLKAKIGVNTGMIMASSIKPDKSMKYTSISDSIGIAKALAEKARDNEILMSDAINARVKNVVSTRKTSPYYLDDKRAIEVYALQDASPKDIREKHRWFVDRALGKK